jgi:hypothetical protein
MWQPTDMEKNLRTLALRPLIRTRAIVLLAAAC